MSKRHWNKRINEILDEILEEMNAIEDTQRSITIGEWIDLKLFIKKLKVQNES